MPTPPNVSKTVSEVGPTRRYGHDGAAAATSDAAPPAPPRLAREPSPVGVENAFKGDENAPPTGDENAPPNVPRRDRPSKKALSAKTALSAKKAAAPPAGPLSPASLSSPAPPAPAAVRRTSTRAALTPTRRHVLLPRG